MSRWIAVREGNAARVDFYFIDGTDCTITVEPRPPYCDRGNWIAKIEARGTLAREMDYADLWPRYYFDLDRAKLEIEAWLQKRGQWKDLP